MFMNTLSGARKLLTWACSMLCRLGKPEEVGAAVPFLASDDASFMTGTSLDVDGGFLAF